MPAYIHKLETSLPQFKYQQDELREQMKQLVADSDLNRRVIHQVYSRSGIESRYSILEDFKQTPLHKNHSFLMAMVILPPPDTGMMFISGKAGNSLLKPPENFVKTVKPNRLISHISLQFHVQVFMPPDLIMTS